MHRGQLFGIQRAIGIGIGGGEAGEAVGGQFGGGDLAILVRVDQVELLHEHRAPVAMALHAAHVPRPHLGDCGAGEQAPGKGQKGGGGLG